MALQTLNTIKQWFKTGLKPTQTQFWDTWDSFRHKFDKIPVKEVEGLDELLLSKADKTVLDHHLADKNAHAPQVNTDWNSESGFSQLLNKPEFKTINGEPLTGDGDIIIEAGGSQNLQTTLANGNETTNGIMFNDDYYNWLKTSIDSRSIRLTDSNSDMLVAIDSAGVVTRDDSQHVSLNPQGIFFNRDTADTAESYLRINESSTGISTVNLPVTKGKEITLAATDDFKTINGESIIGEGNLDIEPQGLKSVLDADPTASYGESKATVMGDYGTSKYNELIVSDETEKTGIYQLKNQLSFDHTALDSNDIGNITLSQGNVILTRDKSNNQTVVDISDPVANTQLRFPAKSEEGKTYTIATTEDFKTINGESIVGSGDISVSGGAGDIPTLQQVLDKDRNATNASINLLSEEGESQTTVHEGGLNISQKTETGFLITDINKLGVSVSKDEETTFVNVLADELSLNKNLAGNPVKQGIVLNEDSAGASTIKLPLTSDGDVKTLATTEDFKTINGESIVGEGDITVKGGSTQNLQQVLDTASSASFNGGNQIIDIFDPSYPNATKEDFIVASANESLSKVGSLIVSPSTVGMTGATATGLSASFSVADGKLLINQASSSSFSNNMLEFEEPKYNTVIKVPAKDALPGGKYYTLATTSDFKTINGESIVGEGNMVIGGTSTQNLQQVLNTGSSATFNEGNQVIDVFDPSYPNATKEDFIIVSANKSLSKVGSLTVSPSTVGMVGSTSTGLSGSFSVADGKLMINQVSSKTSSNNMLEFEEPKYNTVIKVPAKDALPSGKYYTLATTSDFKTINGESIVGEGDIAITRASIPYRVYTAIITQSSTNAPTAIVLENTIGSIPTFTRINTGIYSCNVNQVAGINKMIVFATNNSGALITSYVSLNNQEVIIKTYSNNVLADSLLNFQSGFEIRIYN
ncbi:hypothetical protein ACHRV1_05160 [Flavobacterium aquidurense]|uniref:hypothetical protein n=1 Tax=Flavobacterium aquidurense TaxID=362413 RepID=UPI003757B3A4